MSEPQLGEAPRKRRQSRGSRSDITGMIDEQLDEQELKWTKNEGEYYEAYVIIFRGLIGYVDHIDHVFLY